jgi:hypothetical protein
MPEDIVKKMSKSELRDLVDSLAGLKEEKKGRFRGGSVWSGMRRAGEMLQGGKKRHVGQNATPDCGKKTHSNLVECCPAKEGFAGRRPVPDGSLRK